MDSVFRTASAPDVPPAPSEWKENTVGAEVTLQDKAPVDDGSQAILTALGIDDTTRNMPEEDQINLSEVDNYIKAILQGKGVALTQGAYQRTLDELRFEMGLDSEAEPSVVLSRIGGVVKAWRNLSFISDPREKRRILTKVARAESSSAMNRIVYEAMEDREVWL